MSGIAGICNAGSGSIDKSILEKMTGAMAHRGPDGEGFHVNYKIGLGHRRLSIIQLRDAVHQPMTTEDGILTIVHDGRIYNSAEVSRELKAAGYHFRSDSEAEIILNSYKEWGEDCLRKFNGMWAFAIWNHEKNCLFAARDRIGVKPFFYYFNSEVFIFASEIKAILQHPGVPRKVNERAVYNYLMWGILGYSEETFFSGIKELPPSCCLRFSPPESPEIKLWWDLKIKREPDNLSQDEIDISIKKVRQILEDAVRIRIPDGVPKAATLSGGLDSASVIMLASRMIKENSGTSTRTTGQKLITLSSCYENEAVDERAFIEKVVEAAWVEKNYVFPEGHRFWEELPRIIRQQEEPAGIYSVYARWRLMQTAKEMGIKVILSGDGSDSVLAGDYKYFGNYFLELASRGRFLPLLREIKNSFNTAGSQQLLTHAGPVISGFILGYAPQSFQTGIRSALFNIRGRNTDKVLVPAFDMAHKKSGLSYLHQYYSRYASNLNLHLYDQLSNLTCYIKYVDSLGSAFGIETHSPFMDHRLIEYVFSLPAGLKLRNGRTKWLLRQAMMGIVPEKVRLRIDKNGFGTPTNTWLSENRKQILGLFSRDALSSQFINPARIRDNLDSLLSSTKSGWELWRYINLEMWLKEYF